MNHLKWMGHINTVYEIQKSLRNEQDSCEVTLAAKGGSMRAHRFVLSSCSDLLRSLLADVPMGQETTIVIPDIKCSLLDSVLAFIYMGETVLTSANLSDFLEAINILGIKSAISFECNTTTSTTTTTSATASSLGTATYPVKTISDLQIAQEDLIEQDNITTQKLETQNVMSEQQSAATRSLELFDVYSEPQHKITYSIEHMPDATNANEFILTETSGTFTITQNAKIENPLATDTDKMEDIEEDTDDAHIIEEYSSSTDPIIEISENTIGVSPAASSATTPTTTNTPVIQIKPKIKTIKLKYSPTALLPQQQQQQQQQQNQTLPQEQQQLQESAVDGKLDTSVENITVLKNDSSTNDYNDGALDLAVQAVINEGISLQKAALKFELSKTVLWRRVRKHPDYMKTTRENPILTMAYERLKTGESLKTISRDLDIPMSTLHRHKVRLAQQGRLPEYVTFKKRDANSKDQLKRKLTKAVHACVHEGMSQNHAANVFDIPKSTLWRHLQKRVAEAELAQTIKEEVILS